MSDCPGPHRSIDPVSAPLPYSQTLHIKAGYDLTFTAMDSTSDPGSRVTLEVHRSAGGCSDRATVHLTQGSSTEALGLHLKLERVIASSGGRPPQLTVTYSY